MRTAARVTRAQRIQAALAELRTMIAEKYPEAEFRVRRGVDDPREWWLEARVELDDTEEVADLIIDRLLDFQVEQRLPIYVQALPTERIAAMLWQRTLEENYAQGKWVPADYRRMREATENGRTGSQSA